MIIYQMPFYKEGFDVRAVAEEYIANEGILASDAKFMFELVDGTAMHLEEIDAVIGELADWSFDRIATMDLAILRIAIYEILYSNDAPVSVVINEAVELAKAYGTDDSAMFVNGLMAQVAKRRLVNNE